MPNQYIQGLEAECYQINYGEGTQSNTAQFCLHAQSNLVLKHPINTITKSVSLDRPSAEIFPDLSYLLPPAMTDESTNNQETIEDNNEQLETNENNQINQG